MKDDPTKVKLPRKSDGSEYNILETNPEQQKIAALVIDTIIKWIQKSPDFKPLRLTVCAGAGRGKSFMIHQLTTMIKKMFQRDDVVLTAKIGLFNGSIGKVIEIIYAQGESPNTGHFPQYVLVEFPSYTGKAFYELQPKWVPIPTLTIAKNKRTFTYVPLELSYARTIHKFQGYQAGPMCDINRIICDAGPIKLESLFPGLLYTSLSRATTIGTSSDRSTSAIFFINLTQERIKNLRGPNPNKQYKLIDIRQQWISHLLANTATIDSQNIHSLLQQSTMISYTTEQLNNVIVGI